MKVYIIQNSFIANLASIILRTERMAVTIGNKIYLHNCNKQNFLSNKKWVCHEITHIIQYKRLGIAKFIFSYLLQCLINGYKNNKFETEARERENDSTLTEGIIFI
jgi:hypothetical protein